MNQRSQRDQAFHDTIASTYDATVVQPRALANDCLFAPAYKHLPAHAFRFLDLGCGTGHMAVRLGGYAAELTLVDHSAEMLSEAARRVAAAHKHLPTKTVRGDLNAVAASLVDARAKFDVITTVGVLHHLTFDEVRSLAPLVKKLLAAGGRWIVAEPVLTDAKEPALLRWWNAPYRAAFVLPWDGSIEPDEAPLRWNAMAPVFRDAGLIELASRRRWEIFPRGFALDRLMIRVLDAVAGSRGDGPVHMGVYGHTVYAIDNHAP
jgi:SAM-dependent methyltransferase